MAQVQTTPIEATARVTDRPPILEAARALGLTDGHIARLMGISSEAVHAWAVGKKPIPHFRYIALLFLLTRLTGVVGANLPPQSRYARRAEVARAAAQRWCELARDELEEDTSGIYQAETLERSVALGDRMLAKLEAQ